MIGSHNFYQLFILQLIFRLESYLFLFLYTLPNKIKKNWESRLQYIVLQLIFYNFSIFLHLKNADQAWVFDLNIQKQRKKLLNLLLNWNLFTIFHFTNLHLKVFLVFFILKKLFQTWDSKKKKRSFLRFFNTSKIFFRLDLYLLMFYAYTNLLFILQLTVYNFFTFYT